MRSYRTFPPLPGRLSRTGKGGKVSRPLRGRPPAAGLIEIVKRDPSSLFTQHPCTVRPGGDCADGEKEGPWARSPPHPGQQVPDTAFQSSFTIFHSCRHGSAALAVYLCCTFPEVAFGGRYPLSLPCGARTFLMDGLSACPRDCLSSSQGRLYPMRRRKSTRKISGSRCIFARSVVSFSSYEPPQGGGTKGAIPWIWIPI